MRACIYCSCCVYGWFACLPNTALFSVVSRDSWCVGQMANTSPLQAACDRRLHLLFVSLHLKKNNNQFLHLCTIRRQHEAPRRCYATFKCAVQMYCCGYNQHTYRHCIHKRPVSNVKGLSNPGFDLFYNVCLYVYYFAFSDFTVQFIVFDHHWVEFLFPALISVLPQYHVSLSSCNI